MLTSSGGLAGIDVSDDDDVDMSLFLTASDVSSWVLLAGFAVLCQPAVGGGKTYPMLAVCQ